MDVCLNVQHASGSIDTERVEKLALFAMEQLGLPEQTEVSVTFVDNHEMHGLNLEYRGKDSPTDVLSFECDNLDDGFPVLEPGQRYSLGDVVIAPDVALVQSEQYGNSGQEEIELLLVHGLLHLCGYDHIEDGEAEEMEAEQRRIIGDWSAWND